MEINGPEGTIAVGLLTGLVTSALVAWLFTWRAERRERQMSILRKAYDVARDCQTLLEMTDRSLYDLACRKYAAHQLAKQTANLTGEEKRRTVNNETMRIHLQEVPRGIVDNLAIAFHSYLTVVPDDDRPNNLFSAAKEAGSAAFALLEELKHIDPFKFYFAQVEFRAEQETFVDFIEKMEQDETASYETLTSARDAARRSLSTLIEAIAVYPV